MIDDFFSWFLSAVLPLTKKALSGLGIGTITWQGVDAALAAVIEHIQVFIGQAPADIAGWLQAAGFVEAIGIILGGISARYSLMVFAKWALFL